MHDKKPVFSENDTAVKDELEFGKTFCYECRIKLDSQEVIYLLSSSYISVHFLFSFISKIITLLFELVKSGKSALPQFCISKTPDF